MDCAICYDKITAATGKVELSCSHSFHFSCLTSWFGTQNYNNLEQSCPCCRHESNEHEKMLSTFVYPHNVQTQVDTEAERINREEVARLTAADERAAQAVANAFLVLENNQNNIQVVEQQIVARWF